MLYEFCAFRDNLWEEDCFLFECAGIAVPEHHHHFVDSVAAFLSLPPHR